MAAKKGGRGGQPKQAVKAEQKPKVKDETKPEVKPKQEKKPTGRPASGAARKEGRGSGGQSQPAVEHPELSGRRSDRLLIKLVCEKSAREAATQGVGCSTSSEAGPSIASTSAGPSFASTSAGPSTAKVSKPKSSEPAKRIKGVKRLSPKASTNQANKRRCNPLEPQESHEIQILASPTRVRISESESSDDDDEEEVEAEEEEEDSGESSDSSDSSSSEEVESADSDESSSEETTSNEQPSQPASLARPAPAETPPITRPFFHENVENWMYQGISIKLDLTKPDEVYKKRNSIWHCLKVSSGKEVNVRDVIAEDRNSVKFEVAPFEEETLQDVFRKCATIEVTPGGKNALFRFWIDNPELAKELDLDVHALRLACEDVFDTIVLRCKNKDGKTEDLSEFERLLDLHMEEDAMVIE